MAENVCVFSHGLLDIGPSFEFLFNRNECLNSIDHLLYEFNFGEPDTLLVRNIPFASWSGRCVFAISSTGLNAETLSEFFELVRSQFL